MLSDYNISATFTDGVEVVPNFFFFFFTATHLKQVAEKLNVLKLSAAGVGVGVLMTSSPLLILLIIV